MNFNTKSALYSVVFAASVFGFTAAQAQSDSSSKVPNVASAADSKESNAVSATSHSSGSASLKVKQEPWFSLVYGFEGTHGGSLDKPRAMTAKMWFSNHFTAGVSYTNYDVLPGSSALTGRLRLSALELGYDKPFFTNGKFAASVGASAGLAQIAQNGSVNEATGLIGSVDADLHYHLSGMGLLVTVSYSRMADQSAGVNFSDKGTFNFGVGLTYKAHSA